MTSDLVWLQCAERGCTRGHGVRRHDLFHLDGAPWLCAEHDGDR